MQSIDRARRALRDNPTLTHTALMRTAKVGKGTAWRARRELKDGDLVVSGAGLARWLISIERRLDALEGRA
jgi:hypothetical protein